jgi:hypothetical protein
MKISYKLKTERIDAFELKMLMGDEDTFVVSGWVIFSAILSLILCPLRVIEIIKDLCGSHV